MEAAAMTYPPLRTPTPRRHRSYSLSSPERRRSDEDRRRIMSEREQREAAKVKRVRER